MISLILALNLAEAAPSVSIASDLTPWFLQGYSGIIMLEPEESSYRFGGEVWGMRYPETLLALSDANKGWHWRIELALAVYADWHPKGGGEGWHLGGAVDLLLSEVARDGQSGVGRFWSGEILVRGGYRWFPIEERGLFVNPWVAVGPLMALESPPSIGGEEFVLPPVQVLGTVHLGWRL